MFLVVVSLVTVGCGSSKVADRVHSPSQVAQVFAAHRLALYAPGWNFPKPASVYESALAADASDPLDTNPHHLQLSVTIWWDDAAAADFANPTRRAARSRQFDRALKALFRSSANDPHDRTVRVDNVVADYYDDAYTARLVARLKATMAALASAPTVAPPCSKNFCADSS